MAADPGATRRPSPCGAARAVLGLLAVLVLLGALVLPAGAVDLPPAAAASAAADGSAAVPPGPQEGMQGSAPTGVLRPGSLSAVPAPTSSGAGLLPGPRLQIAPHLVAEPRSRPPTAAPASSAVLAAGGRAPPAPAGP